MRQRVKKWGNSLSLRIPESIAEELHLRPDSEVEMSVRESRLVIEPVARPVYDLDELLSWVDPQTLHGETDWGPPVWKEAW